MATNTGIIAQALQDPVTPVPLTDPQAQTTSTNATTQTATPAAATSTTTVPQANVAGYNPTNVATPTQWNVDANQTVAGQVKNLIDDNSPIVQQARTNAKAAANDRGMLNSSMAVQAGENAAYTAALPIAQADAATQSKAAGYNADQINQANVKNAEFSNSAAQFNTDAFNKAAMQVADSQLRTNLQQLTNTNQVLIQSNAQAADMMNQATGVINNIMMNNQMDTNAKTEASRQVYENLRVQLGVLGKTSGLNLDQLLATNPYA